ncbi:cysteine desulfurase family protein [Parvularcula sp. LCG005]|uniref:cysteine desulfurase family protein n=1 Tax=Parvularcula sp. LCG005 TaxID=3078805 RepID=UPI002943C1BE|nr:cysteine desulfurase family protein [Parvularcula sp. LCG005]WOI54611.1 cysteine desulfurase family protein [Parvularcula sp. LCG005]
MPERLYLDHNATSPLRPKVRDAMLAALDGAHNPSSVHAEGRAAKRLLEDARATLSEVLNTPKEGVIFTSGGTEADNLALTGMVRGPARIRRLMISGVEHDAVKATAKALSEQGVTVETVPVTRSGVVDVDWLDRRLSGYDVETEGNFLLCVMLANNETGVIQPVEKLGPMVWPRGGYLFVDAVQGFGKLDVDFTAMGADLMAIGAHKVGGPVGVGALIVKTGLAFEPLLRGGGQELYRRAGTENIAAVSGFAACARDASPTDYKALAVMRDEIAASLPPGIVVWGKEASRLGNTLCFSAPGFASETQVMVMDLNGIAVSAGSACSSGKVRSSGVLQAMGANASEAGCALRISLGWNTPADAPSRFVGAWTKEQNRIAANSAA